MRLKRSALAVGTLLVVGAMVPAQSVAALAAASCCPKMSSFWQEDHGRPRSAAGEIRGEVLADHTAGAAEEYVLEETSFARGANLILGSPYQVNTAITRRQPAQDIGTPERTNAPEAGVPGGAYHAVGLFGGLPSVPNDILGGPTVVETSDLDSAHVAVSHDRNAASFPAYHLELRSTRSDREHLLEQGVGWQDGWRNTLGVDGEVQPSSLLTLRMQGDFFDLRRFGDSDASEFEFT
jgi:hypothetical protein